MDKSLKCIDLCFMTLLSVRKTSLITTSTVNLHGRKPFKSSWGLTSKNKKFSFVFLVFRLKIRKYRMNTTSWRWLKMWHSSDTRIYKLCLINFWRNIYRWYFFMFLFIERYGGIHILELVAKKSVLRTRCYSLLNASDVQLAF